MKTYFGLSRTAITICIGIPVIISLVSFFRTGILNLPGTFLMFLIALGIGQGIKAIVRRIHKD